MSIRAVMFDLDGTLLDTLDDLTDAMNRTLAAKGFPTHTRDECRYLVGDGVRTFVLKALPEGRRDAETLNEVLRAYRADYRQHWRVKTGPYAGVAELLDALTARGIPMTVLSNKPHDSTVECVAGLLPKWRFAAVMGQREGAMPKPDPAGAIEIARRLDIPPAEFLYVGDTNTDMQTARAAGMHAVGALWGFRTAEELRANGAQELIARPPELIPLLR